MRDDKCDPKSDPESDRSEKRIVEYTFGVTPISLILHLTVSEPALLCDTTA